jgi:lipid A disaccharide synthetase
LLEKREFPELIQKSCNPQSILEAAELMNKNQYLDSIPNKLRDLLVGLSPEDSALEILSL